MSNRTIRRAAERAALKAAKREQKQQAQAQPQTMAAAAGASIDPVSPNVDFAEETTPTNDQPKRPVSDAQRAANRANAQKSTGPTTPEGRAKSSLNAVKTALTGVTVLLPSDDVQAYEAHVQQHIADYSPLTPPEKNLVQRIADADWRINRIASLEAGIYAIGLRKLADLHPDEQDPAVRQSLIKSEVFLAYRRDLNNLALQERRLRNHQTADLVKLQALQKERQEKSDEKAKIQGRMYQAIRLLAQSKEANIPFDPAQFGFEFSLPEITYCFGVVCDAEAANMPVPSLAKVLAAIRSGRIQVKAA
jgi:hypothetical protein